MGKKGIREDCCHAAHVKELLGTVRAGEWRSTLVTSYIEKRRSQGDVADATLDRELELIRPAYILADLEHIAPSIPKLVKIGSNARQGYWEAEQFEALLKELPTECLRDIATFAYWSGWRKGEILSLGWDSWDGNAGTITLKQRDSKGQLSARVLPLDVVPALREVMKRRLAARVLGSNRVFHNGKGSRVGDFWHVFDRAVQEAKVGDRCFHDFRRTMARNLLRAGVPQAIIMAIGGWKTDSMFRRYAIVDEKLIPEAMAKRVAAEGVQKDA